MSEQEEPDLASMRLPSPEELQRERAAAKAVAENPSFVAAVRKLARNTLRTSPRGLDPVYTRKTHPGLGDAPLTSGAAGATAGAAGAAPGVASVAAEGASTDGAGAVATGAELPTGPASAEGEKISPAERRKIIVGFGLILIVINVIGIGVWIGITYAGRTPEAVTTPTQAVTTQGHSSTSAPSAPSPPTGSTAEPTPTASASPTNTPSAARTSESAMTATGIGTGSTSPTSTSTASTKPTSSGMYILEGPIQ